MTTTVTHTEQTLRYTRSRETTIRLPMLGEETNLAASFVLDHDTTTEVSEELSVMT